MGPTPNHALIGEAPIRGSSNQHALYPYPEGCSGHRLCGFTGLVRSQYCRVFHRDNVLDAWPGRAGNGDAFPLDAARRSMIAKAAGLATKRVVLVGRRTSSAMGPCLRDDLEFFTFYRFEVGVIPICAAIVPHPSGRNRALNDPRMRARMGIFMRWYAAEACAGMGEEPQWAN